MFKDEFIIVQNRTIFKSYLLPNRFENVNTPRYLRTNTVKPSAQIRQDRLFEKKYSLSLSFFRITLDKCRKNRYNIICSDTFECWCSTVVVQLIRNQQVVSSILTTSSIFEKGFFLRFVPRKGVCFFILTGKKLRRNCSKRPAREIQPKEKKQDEHDRLL